MATIPINSELIPADSTYSLTTWLRRHPLVGFFSLAFAGTWLFFMPILLSKHGLGLINLPDSAAYILFIAATYAGPFLSAWIITNIVDGKEGVRAWLSRMAQWRVGVKWYLSVLIGYPILFFVPAIAFLGTAGWNAAIQNLPMFVSGYLVTIPIGFFLPTLGEETGWRGFALPRLQAMYGPVLGSLFLGIMHAFWHLPAYFVNGMLVTHGFDPIVFAANSLAIIATTFLWTWLFNNTQKSILFAAFVHAASNAAGGLLAKTLNVTVPGPWFAFEVMGIAAFLVIVLTRGRLGYKTEKEHIK